MPLHRTEILYHHALNLIANQKIVQEISMSGKQVTARNRIL